MPDVVSLLWRRFPPRILDSFGIIGLTLAANLLFSFDKPPWPALISWVVVFCLGGGGVTLSLGAQQMREVGTDLRERNPNMTRADFDNSMAMALAGPEGDELRNLGLLTLMLWLFAASAVAAYFVAKLTHH